MKDRNRPNPIICATCGLAGHTAGQCPDREPPTAGTVVQAHRFELIDSEGRVIAVLAPNERAGWSEGAAQLVLFDPAGASLVELTAGPEYGEVLVRREDNRNAIAVLDADDGYHNGLANAA